MAGIEDLSFDIKLVGMEYLEERKRNEKKERKGNGKKRRDACDFLFSDVRDPKVIHSRRRKHPRCF